MAILSVDGVDVLQGEKASDAESGYVIGPYSSIEIKGYRVDTESEASFTFVEKKSGKGYAEWKGDSSNAGCIGVRFYYEKIDDLGNSLLKVLEEYPTLYPKTPIKYPVEPSVPWNKPYNPEPWIKPLPSEKTPYVPPYWDQNKIWCSGAGTNDSDMMSGKKEFSHFTGQFSCVSNQEPLGFDMTTHFGKKVNSKITTVDFEKGTLLTEMVIYYASRDSLKQMGINLEKIVEVALPKPFDKNMKFCQPPSGWKG